METNNTPVRSLSSMLRRVLRICLRLSVPPGPPPRPPGTLPELPQENPQLKRLGRKFSSEIFAQLLLELPAHRKIMSEAYRSGDYRRLRNSIHQLLGGAAYCDAPELETGLRELRRALKTGEQESIDLYFNRAINIIDSTLRYSGCGSGG